MTDLKVQNKGDIPSPNNLHPLGKNVPLTPTRVSDTLTASSQRTSPTAIEAFDFERPEIPSKNVDLPAVKPILEGSFFSGTSFMSSFSAVMASISELLENIRFKETETDLESRNRLMEQAKEKAELTIQIAEKQAEEKYYQAFTSISNAIISFGSFSFQAKNKGQLDEAVRKGQADIDAQQARVNSRTGPNANVSGGETSSLETEQKTLSDLKSNQSNLIVQQRQEYDYNYHKIDYLTTVAKEGFAGAFKWLEANVTSDIGRLQNQKEILEGLTRIEGEFQQSSQRMASNAYSDFQKMMENLIQVIRTDLQAQGFRPN